MTDATYPLPPPHPFPPRGREFDWRTWSAALARDPVGEGAREAWQAAGRDLARRLGDAGLPVEPLYTPGVRVGRSAGLDPAVHGCTSRIVAVASPVYAPDADAYVPFLRRLGDPDPDDWWGSACRALAEARWPFAPLPRGCVALVWRNRAALAPQEVPEDAYPAGPEAPGVLIALPERPAALAPPSPADPASRPPPAAALPAPEPVTSVRTASPPVPPRTATGARRAPARNSSPAQGSLF